MKKVDSGAWGEKQAASFLKKQGCRIVTKNFACRFGEVDVIARNREYLIFVEVKLRKNADYGEAREFVTVSKQEKLRAAAAYYLMKNPTQLQPRFDVVEIYAPDGVETKKPVLTHLEDAF